MYDQEADILDDFRKHPHPHLVKSIAFIVRGDKKFFIFPWAGEGNLREYWKKTNPGAPDAINITWVINQLCGLADAIHELHGWNCRHTDLKPENLLIIPEPGRPDTVVIADVGLASVHSLATPSRFSKSSNMSGTQRYEPPEVLDEGPRSRAYDLWSMGCICLEFVIWLLWTNGGLKTFNDHHMASGDKFWDADRGVTSSKDARIRKEVHDTIKWMQEKDPRCKKEETAFGDILSLVQNRLLFIEVNKNGSPHKEKYRAESTELKEELYRIRQKAMPGSSYLGLCAKSAPGLTFLSMAGHVTDEATKNKSFPPPPRPPRRRNNSSTLGVPGHVEGAVQRPSLPLPRGTPNTLETPGGTLKVELEPPVCLNPDPVVHAMRLLTVNPSCAERR